MPERIQLRRTAGWRKPEGAIVVGRPSIYGNPFRVGDVVRLDHPTAVDVLLDAELAVRLFRAYLDQNPGWRDQMRLVPVHHKRGNTTLTAVCPDCYPGTPRPVEPPDTVPSRRLTVVPG